MRRGGGGELKIVIERRGRGRARGEEMEEAERDKRREARMIIKKNGDAEKGEGKIGGEHRGRERQRKRRDK